MPAGGSACQRLPLPGQGSTARNVISTNCAGNASRDTPMRLLAHCGCSLPYISLRTLPAAAKAASTSSTYSVSSTTSSRVAPNAASISTALR